MQFSLQGFVHCLLRGHMNLNLNNGELCPSLYKLPDRLTGFFCSCTLLLRLYSVNCIVPNTEKTETQRKQRKLAEQCTDYIAWQHFVSNDTTLEYQHSDMVVYHCIVIHPVTNIVYQYSLPMYHLSVSLVSLNCITVLSLSVNWTHPAWSTAKPSLTHWIWIVCMALNQAGSET